MLNQLPKLDLKLIYKVFGRFVAPLSAEKMSTEITLHVGKLAHHKFIKYDVLLGSRGLLAFAVMIQFGSFMEVGNQQQNLGN